MSSKPAQAKLARPYLKNKIKIKGLEGSVVEGLPSKHEALVSIPNTAQKKKKIFLNHKVFCVCFVLFLWYWDLAL
jgi:hypothetical protein